MTSSRVRRLVVVGGSLAGVRAVESARRTGYDGGLVLVGAEPHAPYDRPPLSKAFLDPAKDPEPVVLRSETDLRDLDVDLRLGSPAEKLDLATREVLVAGEPVPYDALVVATGSTPRTLPDAITPDGSPVAGVHVLRELDDARAIRAALDDGARTVVVGAGFIGSEVASAARARDLPVTVVEALDRPLVRSVGPDVGDVCARLHHDAGTDLRLGVGVAGLKTVADGDGGRVTGVRLDDGTLLPADLVVVGVGARPATGWLEGAGVPLHDGDRGVLCSATLSTGVPDVWAAGDVAHVALPLLDGDPLRQEHWTSAAEQGAAAARHALDPDAARPLETIPYFWSDWYGHRLQLVGSPRGDEARVVDPGGADGAGFVALYRRSGRVVGAFTIDRPRDVMKLRRRVAARGDWDEAVEYAASLAPVGG